MAEAFEICYDAVAEPKVLVACGTEACSGGLFAASRAIDRPFFDRPPGRISGVPGRTDSPDGLHRRHPHLLGRRKKNGEKLIMEDGPTLFRNTSAKFFLKKGPYVLPPGSGAGRTDVGSGP